MNEKIYVKGGTTEYFDMMDIFRAIYIGRSNFLYYTPA
jgi:hypothetical protein